MTANTDVVVIGGGYAGVMAADRLTQRDDVTVALVNPRPTFVERIRAAPAGGRVPRRGRRLPEVLGEGIRLVVDTVTRIGAAERSVTLATSSNDCQLPKVSHWTPPTPDGSQDTGFSYTRQGETA